ncbi:hypothetical protein GWK47_053315 [Chionoecetes opilio]|uniref:Uncharacterized protein n=1 Tax=Chionoecetes opilio TaxID=41210 RepID=A0A8J4XZM8_CHIOP|nr:hypothetical protein GWK47_053315 [Chionoecetes opilio]
MSEWLAVEAIVRQRDKENMAMNLLKVSSESQNGDIPLVGRERSLSNEVFEPDDTLSLGSTDNPGTVQEEEEEDTPFDDPCEEKDTMENNRNKSDEENVENVDSDNSRSKENSVNSVEDEGSDAETMYSKETQRQESKESDTAEAGSHVSSWLCILINVSLWRTYPTSCWDSFT